MLSIRADRLFIKNNLIIPYAFSDSACGFAKVGISELLKN